MRRQRSQFNWIGSSVVAALLVGSFSACATNAYKRSEITEHALNIEQVRILPDNIDSKIDSILEKKGSMLDVQNAICDGTRSRVSSDELSYTVRLVPPKPPLTMSSDQAAANRKAFIEAAEIFLQRYFFFELGKRPIGRSINSDFEDYKTEIIDTNAERKRAKRFATYIPVTLSSDSREVEAQYANFRYETTVPDYTREPAEVFPERHFMLILYPKDRVALLVPKVATVAETRWGWENYGTESSTKIYNTSFSALATSGAQSDGTFNLENGDVFVASDRASEFEGVKVYPLTLGNAEDIALVENHFTISKYKARALSSEESISRRSEIWWKLFMGGTSLKSAPQADGTTTYRVSLDISPLCTGGIPMDQLQAQ